MISSRFFLIFGLSLVICPIACVHASSNGEITGNSEGNSEYVLMPELVVTVSRFEEDPFLVPYTTDVVTQEQMKEFSARTIPEALEFVPGVMIQKTAYGHGSPYVRGFTGRQNLLMLDGIRLNNSTWRSGPAQYWNTIDSLAVDRLELVKGQGSVLYGSDSVGGTLNVISQSASPELYSAGIPYSSGSVFYRYATNGNSSVGRLESNVGVGKLYGIHMGISVKDFGDIRDGAGTQPHTGYGEYDYDFRADWMINGKNTLVIASRMLEQDDVWRTHKTIFAQSWQGTTVGSSDDFHYDQRAMLHYIKLSGKDMNAAVDAYSLTISFSGNKENEYELKKGKAEESVTWVNTLGLSLQMESGLPAGKLVYGADYYHDRVDSKRKSGGRLVEPVLPDGSSYDLLGSFAEYVIPLSDDRWELRGGARYTYARADLGKLTDESDVETSKDWQNLVLGGRALYKASQEWNVFAGISQAFRAPNIDDLGANQKPAQTNTLVNGNSSLKPEQYLTYELGSHYKEGDFSGTLTTYVTQMRDVIVQRPVMTSADKVESMASNSSDGWIMGMEAQQEWEFNPQWIFSAEGSWIYGKADEYPNSSDTSFISRNYISRMAPLMGSLGLRWTHPSRDYWAEIRIFAADQADKLNAADRRDTSRIPPGGTPGYYWVSLYGGWNIKENVKLTVALENLTNQIYRVHGSGANEPGIGLVTGLSVSW